MTGLMKQNSSRSIARVRRPSDMFGVLDDFNEVFDNIFDTDFFAPVGWRAMPLSAATRRAMRVNADEEKMTLSIDLPGIKRDDVKIVLKENELTISAKRGEETFSYRTLVNQDYNPATARASLEDGVLTLEFDRRPETKPREIEVTVK